MAFGFAEWCYMTGVGRGCCCCCRLAVVVIHIRVDLDVVHRRMRLRRDVRQNRHRRVRLKNNNIGFNIFYFNYRIYSRIRWEILDIFSPIFFQFDLYMCDKYNLYKSLFKHCTSFIGCVVCFKTIKINFNFGHFLANIFSIRLIRGSTYTRVYTVYIYKQ